jgi:hypothetical protein
MTVRPEETDELLANPGIGWQTFNRSSGDDANLPDWIPSSTYYARWGWSVVEPRPGKIDTDMIDGALKDARDSGQKLAFRVMSCTPNKSLSYGPSWMREVGGRVLIVDRRGVEGLEVVDLDDPVVLGRHLDLIRRLGERYDGNPDLDHVDIGSVGWYGEWHMSGSKVAKMPTLETRMKVVDAYLAAFKKTQLIMLLNGEQCATYAMQHGAGWRIDSLGDLGRSSATWNHMKDSYPDWYRKTQAQEVWKTSPIAYEPPDGVADYVKRGWPLRYIFNYGLALHGSFYNGKSGKLSEDPLFKEELQRFLRRLGYRLVVNQVTHAPQARAGSPLEIKAQWQNIGSAPCYKPYRVAYRLSNGKGYVRVFVSPMTVNNLMPGSIAVFTEDFMKEPKDLPPGQVQENAHTISLPADLKPGNYTLSLGVVGESSEAPVLRLGIKSRAKDGWYPVSKLLVKEGTP